MLKRKFERTLNEWSKTNKVLLVDGARQVGKSFLIREFCKKNFKNYIEINLADHKEIIPPLEHANNVDDFLFVISSVSRVPLIEKETVIFLDEIQLAPQIDFQTLAKPLVLDGRYRFIFSGSLLGVTEFNIALDPAGFLYSERMFPLDFEEFLWANNVQQNVIDKLEECFVNKKEVPNYLHSMFIDYFYKYLLIGGMPEVVDSYVQKRDLPTLNNLYKAIEQHYVKDITKYAPVKKQSKIRLAYQLLPSELNSKSKRFTLSVMGKHSELKKVDNDFLWLANAGIAIPVYNVDEPKVPLLLSKNSRLLKLFSSDCGMLAYRLMDTDVQKKILAHEKDINYGAIFENAVAQELTAHHFDEIYYFSSKKQGEVDFLLTYHGEVLPLEIKSGKDYKRHVALDNLLNNEDYAIKQAFIFADCNVKVEGKRTYYPIYMIAFLKRNI